MTKEKIILGIDEAGRGCLAGPVVAAGIILPNDFDKTVLKDSKILSSQTRLKLYSIIKSQALDLKISIINNNLIDKLNILNATLQAMKDVVIKCKLTPDLVLIDGNVLPKDLNYPAKAIVRGDSTIPEISAASIVAKVLRDKLMCRYDRHYKGYEFKKNKGYGTESHYNYLSLKGPCPIHRMSFNLTKQLTLF